MRRRLTGRDEVRDTVRSWREFRSQVGANPTDPHGSRGKLVCPPSRMRQPPRVPAWARVAPRTCRGRGLVRRLLSALTSCLLAIAARPAVAPAPAAVFINQLPVPADRLGRLRRYFRLRIPDGNWWYDPRSGAFGRRGGPTLAFLLAALALGGPVAADACPGEGALFINNRALHPADVRALASWSPSPPVATPSTATATSPSTAAPCWSTWSSWPTPTAAAAAPPPAPGSAAACPSTPPAWPDTATELDPETGALVMTFR